MTVSVRERILAIRLMEKMSVNPAYADVFGIVAQSVHANLVQQTASDSAKDKS